MIRDSHAEQRLARHVQAPAIYAYDAVPSTMDIAHELARGGAAEGTLVVARRQQQGKGRLGRVWESPEGGVYLSMIFRSTRSLEEVPQLSLVAGLAAAEAIQEAVGLIPSIRWPNDLLLRDKKVGGILVEFKDGAAVIGIGINVTTGAGELPETATSLKAEGAECDPTELTGALYRHFRTWYDAWNRHGFAPVRDALRPWIGLFGQLVSITTGQRIADSVQRIEGQAIDIDEAGRLVMRMDSGLLRAFDMGEVTLLR